MPDELRPEDLLTQQLADVIDPLIERSTGIHNPDRYWYWRRLQVLAKAKLLLIVPDKTRGFNLVRLSWTEAGLAALAKLRGVE
jgi:hypothetical protein